MAESSGQRTLRCEAELFAERCGVGSDDEETAGCECRVGRERKAAQCPSGDRDSLGARVVELNELEGALIGGIEMNLVDDDAGRFSGMRGKRNTQSHDESKRCEAEGRRCRACSSQGVAWFGRGEFETLPIH